MLSSILLYFFIDFQKCPFTGFQDSRFPAGAHHQIYITYLNIVYAHPSLLHKAPRLALALTQTGARQEVHDAYFVFIHGILLDILRHAFILEYLFELPGRIQRLILAMVLRDYRYGKLLFSVLRMEAAVFQVLFNGAYVLIRKELIVSQHKLIRY